jgi:hypothetical protein
MPVGCEADARSFCQGLLGICEKPKPQHLAMHGGCWFETAQVKVHLGVEPDFVPARKVHPAFIVDDPFGNRIELMEAIKSER